VQELSIFCQKFVAIEFCHYLADFQSVKACFRAILGYAIATKIHVKEY